MINLTQLYIFAQGKLGTPSDLYLPDNSKSADAQFQGVVKAVYVVAAIIAVVVIIIAGIQLSLASGNPQSVSKAKNAIIYSLIGLVVVALAFMITSFVLWRMA